MIQPRHFLWRAEDKVGVVTLNRPERKNPLTFESYAELRDFFLGLRTNSEIKTIVITGSGGNFCSGGDAVEGVCAGAGAIIAMASDLRYAAPSAKTAFLFVRVGLAGCDMGACAMLPRIIGQGRAAELLYTGRSMSAEEGLAWGFFNRVSDRALDLSIETAKDLAAGPTLAHAMTKKMLHDEWHVGVDQAIDMEAVAQADLMRSGDLRRAYEAFAAKKKPVFEGD